MRYRHFLLWAIFCTLSAVPGASSPAAQTKQPVDWVDPLIDSASSRWIFFSSACRPFGMVNLSPDTDVEGAWNSGYCYHTGKIRFFSHVHAWQLSGVPVMPTTGPMRGPQGSDAYRSSFSHDSEIATAGYHAVTLDDYDLRVELTSTDRVGFHRYTLGGPDPCNILFDLTTHLGPTDIQEASVEKVSDTELAGTVVNAPTRRRPKATPIHFVARFDRPFEDFGGWSGKRVLDDLDELSGKETGAFVRYDPARGKVILLKVALSYVSIEQARKNLDAELPGWDFDAVKDESRRVWNDWLGKIEVEGGTDAQKTKFYTDLWHTLLGRRLASDADGRYCDMTGPEPVVRQIPLDRNGKPRYAHYNSDAFWNTFWNVNQVWALAYPELTSGWVRFLIDMYEDGGLIPRGPSGHNYSFVMIAAHSTPFIVGAYMKGIRDFDVEKAYQGMRKNAFPGGLMSKAGYEHHSCIGGGIEFYIERGYIPDGRKKTAGFHADGAAQTLEYAYDDWCLAQLAKELGKEDDYRLFMSRAANYRNIFDPSTKFMRPRKLNGDWWKPFDPLAPKGWCEGNAWQYTWFVPHDVAGLIRLMGGRDAFNQKLNHAFEQARPNDFVKQMGYVNFSNQPPIHMAHLFNYSGAPWLSQKWVRLVKQQAFGGITPDSGYRGDEDQGQAGGLGVMMALGLFQVRGGAARRPVYEITTPLFDRVVIHLDKKYYPGGQFEIIAPGNSPESTYIQSATLSGQALERPWFHHSQLIAGGRLELELGTKPNKAWGSRPQDAPPSMSDE